MIDRYVHLLKGFIENDNSEVEGVWEKWYTDEVSQAKTSQELRMLSSVTINCQITKIVMNSGSQLSEL